MLPLRTNLASLVNTFEDLDDGLAIISADGLRHRPATYRQVATLARRFAAELENRGIRKGDRVLLLGENNFPWVAAFFGCVLRGVLPVPLDISSPDHFVDLVARDVAPLLMVTGSGRSSRNLTIPALALERLERDISMNQASAIAGLEPDDPVQIIFTSGTTATPKGIVHTHRNVLASLLPIEEEASKYRRYQRIFHPIRVLHTLPLSHVFGQFMGLWLPPALSLEVHYRSRLVAPEIVEYIKRSRISVLAAVPRVMDLLQQHLVGLIPNLPKRIADAGSLTAAQRWWHFRDIHKLFGFKFWALVCGGAALPPASEQFWNALGFAVVQGYGMTETTALVSVNHPFKPARGTVGQVLPGREVRLGDDGEVLVRGETIAGMTWRDGTMQSAQSEWLATGDLAELNADGSLRFRGRKKDVIVTSSGLNIYPGDLEGALEKQQGIRGAVVVETSSVAGPEPFAVLLAAAENIASSAVAQANGSLAEFQQIRRWLVWPDPDFPRTTTGKVLRHEITRRLAEGRIAEPPSSDGPLDLDSLGRVQLQAQIESRYGIALDDAAVQSVRTESDITALVRDAPSRQPLSPDHRYSRWPWSPVMQGVRALFLDLVAMPLLRFLAKPKRSKPRSVASVGPFLLVANHVTSYDAPFVLYALPRHLRRHVAIAMSAEMILDWRCSRRQGHWLLNALGPLEYWVVTALFNIFPLPQQSGFRRSFEHAGAALDRGYSVLVFPEGRRADDGSLQPFKSGAGLLWRQLGVPAIPVRLEGLGKLKMQRKGWFRSGEIVVTMGPPIELPTNGDAVELTELLRRGVVEA